MLLAALCEEKFLVNLTEKSALGFTWTRRNLPFLGLLIMISLCKSLKR